MRGSCYFLILGAIFSVGCDSAAAQSFSSEQVQSSYALPASGRVFIRNVFGNVSVTTWDQPNVKVVSVKRAPTRVS